MSKKFFFISFLLFCLTTPLQAQVLTIDQEPPELQKLRSDYEQQLKNASSPAKLKQLQNEFEAAKEKTLLSPAVAQQVASLENARDQEVKKIETLYNLRIEALKKDALVSVENKYQVIFDNFKNNSGKNIKNQYIIDLKNLEDKLIRQNNLAGALVVQTQRNKSMGLSAPAAIAAPVAAQAVASAPTAVKKTAAPVASQIAKKTNTPTHKMSAASPQLYASQTQGIAGSGSNSSNNIYAFDVQRFGDQSWLSFHGYGRKTNRSFGEVYLITPAGQRHQVASWSPEQLKATNYYGVKSAKDVQAIKADISQFVKTTGTYKVEFAYRDGNEPLTIYQVEIKTW